MDKRISTPVVAALLLALGASSGRGDDPDPRAGEAAVRRLVPEGWTVEPETFANTDRLLPGARSWYCRLKAKGGFPYERIVLASDGQVLHRSRDAAFLARVRAARIEARREATGWTVVEGGAVVAESLLDAFHRLSPGAGRDAGAALTAAVVLRTSSPTTAASSPPPSPVAGRRESRWAWTGIRGAGRGRSRSARAGPSSSTRPAR